MYTLRVYLKKGIESADEFTKAKAGEMYDRFLGYSIRPDHTRPFADTSPLYIEFPGPLDFEHIDRKLIRFVGYATLRGNFPMSPARENGRYYISPKSEYCEALVDGSEKARLIHIVGDDILSVLSLYLMIRVGTIRPTTSYDKEQIKPK